MQELFKLIVMLADNDLTVLVQGESGVGKELVAHAIHDSGARATEPFVAVNCAAIPEQLIESEFFGHERGAFTDAKAARAGRFESAGAGTLFLDEISELPLHLQSKLLRVLQERSFERVGSVAAVPFRARLICASNRDLVAAVKAGAFREDLYHRVNIVTLQVPPLRDRREDIAELVHALIRRANREVGKSIASVEQAVMDRLRTHEWPGNVRELEHVIKRSVLVAHGSVLTVHDLSFDPGAGSARDAEGPEVERLIEELARLAPSLVEAAGRSDMAVPLHELALGRLERALVEAALAATGGNQVAASRLLGMSRSTLRAKLPD
jgi:DNA-binding NtrC family response regulator